MARSRLVWASLVLAPIIVVISFGTLSAEHGPVSGGALGSDGYAHAWPVGIGYSLSDGFPDVAISDYFPKVELLLQSSPAPDFELDVSPGWRYAGPGEDVDWMINATPIDGFSDPITLTVEGLPADAVSGFSANPINPPYEPVTLSVHLSGTTPEGIYPLSVEGSSPNLIRHATPELVVPSPDFAVYINPTDIEAEPGDTVSCTVEIVPYYGFSEPVSLTVEGLPTGAAHELPANPIAPPYDPATLSIELSNSTPPGKYSLHVMGGTQNLWRSSWGQLTVIGPEFALSLSPDLRTVEPGGATFWTASVTAILGFTEPITLTVEGLPEETAYSLSENPLTSPYAPVTLTVQPGFASPRGAYYPTLVGSSPPLTRTATTLLVVSTSDFEDYITYAGETSPSAVGIADLNSDGLNDVAMTAGNRLHVLLQEASGGLSDPVTYAAGSAPYSIAAGDFDNDKRDDVVVANIGGDTVDVFFQRSDGTMADRTTYPTAPSPDAVAAGDLNSDGLDDFAVAHWGDPSIAVFLQQGDGNFSVSNYPVPWAGFDDLDLGDVNGDGRTDVVKINGQGQNPNLSIYLQETDGGLEGPFSYDFDDGLPQGGAVGDLTGDGLADVAVSHTGNRPMAKLVIWSQTADGTLELDTVRYTYDCPEPVEIADVNLDGLDDVLLAHGGWRTVSVYLQRPDGNLAAYDKYPIPFASHYKPQGMDVGDINDDGLPDVVLADYNHGLVVLYHSHNLPYFKLGICPASIATEPGSQASWAITATPHDGFTGTIDLAVVGLPPTVTYQLSANQIAPPYDPVTLTLHLSSNTPEGSYSLSIVGTSNELVQVARTALVVAWSGFNVDVNRTNLKARPGDIVSCTVEVLAHFGFSDPVSLTVVGLPNGAAYDFSGNPVGPPYDPVTLTVHLGPATPDGSYPLSVVGTSDELVRSAPTVLIIARPDFQIDVSPGSRLAGPGETASWTINATPTNDFSDPITLTVEGLPPDAVYGFTSNPINPPYEPVTLSTHLSTTTPEGEYLLSIVATSPDLMRVASTQLVVPLPGFHMRVSPMNLEAEPRDTLSCTVEVLPYCGFSDSVFLSVEGLPGGVVQVFSPNPITPPTYHSALTLEVGPTCRRGVYPLLVTGSAAHQTRAVTAWLVIGADYHVFIPLGLSTRTRVDDTGPMNGLVPRPWW